MSCEHFMKSIATFFNVNLLKIDRSNEKYKNAILIYYFTVEDFNK